MLSAFNGFSSMVDHSQRFFSLAQYVLFFEWYFDSKDVFLVFSSSVVPVWVKLSAIVNLTTNKSRLTCTLSVEEELTVTLRVTGDTIMKKGLA